MQANPGRLEEEMQLPRPDVSPRELEARVEFQEIVAQLKGKVHHARVAAAQPPASRG
jgi:hypothetical protein